MKQIIVDNQATTYYITEEGKCFNQKTGKWLTGQISNSGYLNYNLTLNNGIKRRLYAHRLVAIAYIPNNNLEAKEVNHIDGNKLNNCVENLEWVTASQNQKHNIIIGNKKNVIKVYQFNKDKQLINTYLCIEDVAEAGYNPTMVRQEVHKKDKQLTLGYYWNDEPVANFNIVAYPNTGKSKTVLQYTKEGELVAEYVSANEAARQLGVNSHSHIGECCRGKIKSYKGYIWKYKE